MRTQLVNGQQLHAIQDEEFTLIYASETEALREVNCRQFHSVFALGAGIGLVVAAILFEASVPNSYCNQLRENSSSAQPTAIDLIVAILLIASLKCFKDTYRLRASLGSFCGALFGRRQPHVENAVELDNASSNRLHN